MRRTTGLLLIGMCASAAAGPPAPLYLLDTPQQTEFLTKQLPERPAPPRAPDAILNWIAAGHRGQDDRFLKPPSDVTDTGRAAEAWLTAAERGIRQGNPEAARRALGNVIGKLPPKLAAQHDHLRAQFATRPNQTNTISPYTSLAQALMMGDSGQVQAAERGFARLSLDDRIPASLRDRARIELARLRLAAKDREGALVALRNLNYDSIEAAQGLWLLADNLSASDQKLSTLPYLSLLAAGDPPNAYVRAGADRLASSLIGLGAVQQARELLVAQLNRLVGETTALAEVRQAVENHPMSANRDAKSLIDGVSEPALHWLRTVLIRPQINEAWEQARRLWRLEQRLQAWQGYFPSYQRLLNEGASDLAQRATRLSLELGNTLLPKRLPDGGKEIAALETELSRIVGLPENEGERYRLLYGLSQWQLQRPWDSPWWGDEYVNPERAQRSLQELRERMHAVLQKHGGQPYPGLERRLKELQERLAPQITQLRQVRLAIEGQLRQAALRELDRQTLLLEQALLRYSVQVLSWSRKEREPRFSLETKQPGPGVGITTLGRSTPARRETPTKALDYTSLVAALRHLATTENRSVRSEARLRLGNLYLENAERRESGADPLTGVDGGLDQAIALLQELAPRQATAGGEEILYQLAHALDLKGNLEGGAAQLTRMVQLYPRGRHYREGQFRRAEVLFALGRFGEAQAAYQATLAAGDSLYRQQARYKHGWSRFKQGDYETALDDFFAVIGANMPAEGIEAAKPTQRELLEDTLRVISLGFSYLGGEKAVARFLETDRLKGNERTVYRALGELYLRKERYREAAEAFAAFVRRKPDDPLAPTFSKRIIATYRQAKFPSLLWPAREAFVKRYGPLGEYWNRHADRRNQLRELIRPELQALAQRDHALYQRTRKEPERAEHWYRQIIRAFPEDPKTIQTRFLLAELLFDTARYAEAATEYERVAYGPTWERAGEAAYGALISYQRAREQTPDSGKTELANLEITSAQRFIERYPAHPQFDAVLARLSEEWLARKDTAKATALVQVLIERRPAKPLVRRAWTVLAHATFADKQWAQAEQAYSRVLRLGPSPTERAALEQRLAASVYQQGEAARESGKAEEAIEQFLRVSRVAPDSPIRANAEFDAATLMLTAQQWKPAIRLLEKFRDRLPNHELTRRIPEKLAIAYERNGQPRNAAAELETIIAAGKDPALVREALLHTGHLYMQAKAWEDARRVYKDYVARYPLPLEPAMEARWALAENYAQRKDLSRRAVWLRRIVKAEMESAKASSARTRTLAARGALELGEMFRKEFENLHLKLPLKESLIKKKKALEGAVYRYTQAARFGIIDVTTTATFHTAELYRRLAKDLMTSQRPRGLDKLALEQYDILLEEQALPFEDKAIEVHALNVARISDGVFDDWIDQSLNALRELIPGRYLKKERIDDYVE